MNSGARIGERAAPETIFPAHCRAQLQCRDAGLDAGAGGRNGSEVLLHRASLYNANADLTDGAIAAYTHLIIT
jgi:hypothetical protein